nr:ParB/RepB/Spo0J family partition protein [Corynebacterium caspium]
MPKPDDIRKGGLGRGLAALIPSGPAKPRLSDAAADAVLGVGGSHGAGARSGGARGVSSLVANAPARNPADIPGTPKTAGTSAAASEATSKATPAGAPGAPDAATEAVDNGLVSPTSATYVEIPIGDIEPNEKQPREIFEEDALNELVHSIREFGLLQPIVVREKPGPHDKSAARYELIMGERRWRASAKAGLKVIPAIVRQTDDSTMLRDALLENIHRVQLNPLEEGAAYQQLLEEFGVTQEELAAKLGRSRPTVTNTIRLLKLPVPVQKRVAAGVLSAGHARAIMGIKTAAQTTDQISLAERIIAEGLSVRATEEAVTLLNRGEKLAEKPKREPLPQPEYLTRTADRLADIWDTKVTVTMGKRKGKMVIEFGDQEDFQRIMELIEGQH